MTLLVVGRSRDHLLFGIIVGSMVASDHVRVGPAVSCHQCGRCDVRLPVPGSRLVVEDLPATGVSVGHLDACGDRRGREQAREGLVTRMAQPAVPEQDRLWARCDVGAQMSMHRGRRRRSGRHRVHASSGLCWAWFEAPACPM